MHKAIVVGLISLLLGSLLNEVRAEDSRPQVVVRENAVAGVGTLVLGQVAEITAGPELLARLAVVSLGPAPVPGGERVLTRGYLRLRLRCAGIDPEQLTLSGAEQVTVGGAAVVVARPAPPAGTVSVPEAPTVPLAPPTRLDWNAPVTVVARCGLVEVRAVGHVQGRPAVGETAQVRLLTSGALVEGVLLSLSLVEVPAFF